MQPQPLQLRGQGAHTLHLRLACAGGLRSFGLVTPVGSVLPSTLKHVCEFLDQANYLACGRCNMLHLLQSENVLPQTC